MFGTVSARHRASMTLALLLSVGNLAAPAAAVTTGSWNDYRWARSGTLALKTVNRTSSEWTSYFAPALRGWSIAPQIDLIGSRGTVNSACDAVYATIQVCNGKYGANGWLGYANVWLSAGRIVQATVRLNDTYFSQSTYNADTWRTSTLCQELGHTLGLAHNNANRGDTNTGSCMDYTNDPDGGLKYGKSNLAPGSMDFTGLNVIYKTLDRTQLPGTKLTMDSEGLYIPGFDHDDHAAAAVPEPTTWAMMIAGFGLTGIAARRRRRAAIA